MRFFVIPLVATFAFAQVEPQTAEEFYARAQQSLANQQLERVVEDCTLALGRDPDFQEALLMRATAYSKLNQRAKAIADLDVVLKMRPRASTFVFRGNQLMLQSQFEAAAADFTEAIRRAPGSAGAYQLRALARQTLSDLQGAAADRVKAAELGAQPQPAKAGEVLRVGPGITPPKLLNTKNPSYSEEARAAKMQGTVVLALVVDEQGQARDFRVQVPLGYGLDEKAIEAVQQWTFQPAMKDGHPVAVQSTIEVSFRLL